MCGVLCVKVEGNLPFETAGMFLNDHTVTLCYIALRNPLLHVCQDSCSYRSTSPLCSMRLSPFCGRLVSTYPWEGLYHHFMAYLYQSYLAPFFFLYMDILVDQIALSLARHVQSAMDQLGKRDGRI